MSSPLGFGLFEHFFLSIFVTYSQNTPKSASAACPVCSTLHLEAWKSLSQRTLFSVFIIYSSLSEILWEYLWHCISNNTIFIPFHKFVWPLVQTCSPWLCWMWMYVCKEQYSKSGMFAFSFVRKASWITCYYKLMYFCLDLVQVQQYSSVESLVLNLKRKKMLFLSILGGFF